MYSIFIFFFIFIFVLFINEINIFSKTKSFLHYIQININQNQEFHPIFIVLFFIHGFQVFNESTATLTISNSRMFTDAHKNVSKHVVIED